MSMYTTGELARLCSVSVRTVQYYDERGILVPSEFSEGGRRLYNEDDLGRMKIICFLRDAGIPINSIQKLFSEDNPDKVISVLLEQQSQTLDAEMAELKSRLEIIEGIKRELKNIDKFSVESIGDIARIMEDKNKLKRLRAFMVITGLPINILQWVSIILWITKGVWWLFVVHAVLGTVYGIFISAMYFKRIEYICPECHTAFKPSFKDVLFAKHTPTLRELTCTCCGRHGFCVEIYERRKSK